MSHIRLAIFLLLASGGVLLGGCTQGNSGDDAATGGAAIPIGLDRFLLFPNPIVDTSGNFQTDTNTFAQAYYGAVDPDSERGTLAAWKNKNQFGIGGSEFVAVFRDVRDLGYGRRMTGRRNSDGSIAFFVENYNVSKVPGGYSQVNVEAAVVRDPTWHVGTNAIEWSPAQCKPVPLGTDPPNCNPLVNFTKYFNFDPATGQRQNMLDLDGRGLKAMPGVCISCHGGRADPLTPQSTFALVENASSRKRGDVQGKLQGFNVDSFEWSTTPGFTRADQESVLKIFNQWVLCSYPGAGSATGTWGTCNQPTAGANEWQGSASAMIQDWYGGAGMPNAQFSDTYLAGWNTGAANVQLYRNVVVPFCRTCHLLRGTTNQSDIDFDDEAKFRSYATRIKAHVFDRGNMPLAFLVYQDFWKSNAPSILASYIDSVLGAGTATNVGGGPLKPGRPIADPGPNRMVRTGFNATLYGGDSLFATSYSWTLDPATPGATITNPNSPTATFFSNFGCPVVTPCNYTVHLTVSSRGLSDSKAVTITVDSAFRDPATLKFAHVKNVLKNGSTCTTCHLQRAVVQPSATPPIWYTDFDRNFSGAVDAADDNWFYSEIMGRVNLTEISDSPLLRKPSRAASEPTTINHHNGLFPFDLSTSTGLSNYSVIYNWILNGAPSGGVAANVVVGTPQVVPIVTVGPPPATSANISLDGSQSLGTGALTYAWSIVSQPGGATIIGTSSPTATLNVQAIGTYVVQLLVSNGSDTDTTQNTINVSEPAISANFNPATGAQSVSFSGSPSRGDITLTSISIGSPTNCRWEVLSGPAGARLDGSVTLDVTKSCGVAATLNVPVTSVGGTYQVRLTASNIGSSTATHNISVISGTPVTANIAVGATARTFTGNPPSATVSLNGGASSGALPLSYAWSITAQPDSINYPASITTGSVTSTLTVKATGSYTVQLQVTDGAANSTTSQSTFSVTPTNGTTFQTMTTILGGCGGCHSYAAGATNPDPVNNSGLRPSWANENDSNGKTLWQRVFQRVISGNPGSSLLYQNPTNTDPGGHGGGCQSGFGCGIGGSGNDTSFSNWITDGAPPGN